MRLHSLVALGIVAGCASHRTPPAAKAPTNALAQANPAATTAVAASNPPVVLSRPPFASLASILNVPAQPATAGEVPTSLVATLTPERLAILQLSASGVTQVFEHTWPKEDRGWIDHSLAWVSPTQLVAYRDGTLTMIEHGQMRAMPQISSDMAAPKSTLPAGATLASAQLMQRADGTWLQRCWNAGREQEIPEEGYEPDPCDSATYVRIWPSPALAEDFEAAPPAPKLPLPAGLRFTVKEMKRRKPPAIHCTLGAAKAVNIFPTEKIDLAGYQGVSAPQLLLQTPIIGRFTHEELHDFGHEIQWLFYGCNPARKVEMLRKGPNELWAFGADDKQHLLWRDTVLLSMPGGSELAFAPP